ncbi:MAG: hypothetical protein DCF30_00455 [Hyphomicrobiales bacterium]|nr:MAG: hypothetical protein DCF30_00455 [Hyphomicrobiales bacterium]
MWYVLLLTGSVGLAIWLALTGAGIYALPLVIIAAGLTRTIVRRAQGRRIAVADVTLPDRG